MENDPASIEYLIMVEATIVNVILQMQPLLQFIYHRKIPVSKGDISDP